MRDAQYDRPLFTWGPKSKELVALLAGAAVHAPLFPVAPFFTGTLWFCMWRYYRLHKRAHRDPSWARAHLPWHVDHHLGRNQNQNWCVTHPFFDYLMGTRKRYLGTKEEREDLGRGGLAAA
jgi:sterol desaturase/sphingolipid hydroxylase (fatty acid hydroxylase superfamily)